MTRIETAQLSLVEGQRRQSPPEIAQSSVRGGRFYVLVEVSAPTKMWDDASREIVHKAVRTFSASQMGETSALQAAAEAVNDYLLARNAELPKEDHIWAGLNALFVQGEDLYLAQAGPALTYIARAGSITRFPKSFEDLQTNRMEALTPLGERPGIKCRLAHFHLQPDDLVTLAASHLPTLAKEEAIAKAVRGGDPDHIIEALARLAKSQDFSALTLQYEPAIPEEESPDQRASSRRRGTMSPVPAPSSTVVAQTDEPVEVDDEEDEWEDEPPWEEDDVWEEVWEEEEAAAWDDADAWGQVVDEGDAYEGKYIGEDEEAYEETDGAIREEPTGVPDPGSRHSVPPESMQSSHSAVEPTVSPSRTTAESTGPSLRAIPEGELSPHRSPRRARKSNRGTGEKGQTKTITGTARSINERYSDSSFDAGAVTDYLQQFLAALAPVSNLVRTGVVHMVELLRSIDWAGLFRRLFAFLTTIAILILKVVSLLITWWQRSAAPVVTSIAPALDRLAYRLWKVLNRSWQAAKRVMLQMLPGNRPVPRARNDAVPPPPGDGSGFLRTVALVVPFVVLAAVLVVGWNVPGEPAKEPRSGLQYTALIEDAADLIGQAGNVDEEQAQLLLEQADKLLDQAEPLEVETGQDQKGQVAALRRQMQELMDQAGTILRPPVQRVASTGTEGAPEAVVQGVDQLFVLEPAHASIYRLQPSSQEPVALHPPTMPLLSAEQRLAEGVVAGKPQLITWVPAGGSRSLDSLVILTDEGQLFDFQPEANLLRQLTFRPVVGEIRVSEGYGGNLYFLDPAHKQIWRYMADSNGEYSTSPEAWLTEVGQEQIGKPIDMAIDGYIYLLDESGEVNQFQVGERRTFALDPINPPLTEPVAMAKAPPESTDMFIADRQRVVRFDQDGRFLVEYRAPIGSDWGAIRDIDIDGDSQTLFILTGKGVYRMDVSERPQPATEEAPTEEPSSEES